MWRHRKISVLFGGKKGHIWSYASEYIYCIFFQIFQQTYISYQYSPRLNCSSFVTVITVCHSASSFRYISSQSNGLPMFPKVIFVLNPRDLVQVKRSNLDCYSIFPPTPMDGFRLNLVYTFLMFLVMQHHNHFSPTPRAQYIGSKDHILVLSFVHYFISVYTAGWISIKSAVLPSSTRIPGVWDRGQKVFIILSPPTPLEDISTKFALYLPHTC